MNLLELNPPHNVEAEQAVIGSVLLSNDAIEDISDLVAEDFYRPSHQKIFSCILDLRDRMEPIDSMTLADELRQRGIHDMIGGNSYILELTGAVPSSANAKKYAEIVKSNSQLRKMIDLGRRIMASGLSATPEEAENILNEAAGDMISLTMQTATDEAPYASRLMERLIDMVMSDERTFITPPGIPGGRCEPGDLVVVAAGTSVGKTALSLSWADEWSKDREVVYYEYEMPEVNLIARLICRYAGVSMSQIQDGNLTDEEKERIEDAALELTGRSLRIQEIWCNINQLVAKIRKDALSGAEVVFIDHLGLIPFDVPRSMNYARAVGSQVTNRLKRLASELGIIIVLIVQLNREGQHNPGLFPRLLHLRDSGEIEQDAAVVFTVWSDRSLKGDEHWARKVQIREDSGLLTEDEIGSSEFDLVRVGTEKNRNGPLSEKFFLFYGEQFYFEDRQATMPVIREPVQTELDMTTEGMS